MPYQRKQVSTNFINKAFLNDDCIVDAALETFTGRWISQVLVCIKTGSNKFGLIKHRLPGISDHMLGLRLKHLVDNNLITKNIDEGEKTYEVTSDGHSLVGILENLARWQSKRLGLENTALACFNSVEGSAPTFPR